MKQFLALSLLAAIETGFVDAPFWQRIALAVLQST